MQTPRKGICVHQGTPPVTHHAVLQIDTGHAQSCQFAEIGDHGLGCRAIAGLDINSQRQIGYGSQTSDQRLQFRKTDLFSVGIAQQIGNCCAGSSERRVAGGFCHTGTGGIPDVGEQQRFALLMELGECH
ncbi:hypothetical protein WT81_30860 [Burkholderia stagnalis]|nr:hypothetical protein WS59_14105 [Burkholderia stagnalis]KVN17001.1 hypothetical protein WT10_21215 [Burkholderia stagnalis]KWI77886.1 hypothetical protein WT75_02710 [Burkholderia stagnalis]KWK48235.1 hypothetical protein WT81_30860 [Burkholderia stagnalis]KWK54568.1 hypothetical protein WT80_03790 [Burkholderia stagnalis]